MPRFSYNTLTKHPKNDTWRFHREDSQTVKERALWADGTANTKAMMWEDTWHVLGATRRTLHGEDRAEEWKVRSEMQSVCVCGENHARLCRQVSGL